jgi:hypothetical protein
MKHEGFTGMRTQGCCLVTLVRVLKPSNLNGLNLPLGTPLEGFSLIGMLVLGGSIDVCDLDTTCIWSRHSVAEGVDH